MNKFKEIIFLKNLKRVGKATIYKNYWEVLNESKDFDDFVLKIEKTSKFSKEDIDKAIQNASDLFDYVNNDEEIHVITVFDDNYPEKLMVMENKRPLILYIKGNVDALTKPNISVIGTRKPSEISQSFEKELVENITKTDRVVVSGLALGCDKIAHQTTVDAGKITIAVLPSGVNVIKPASNKKLADDILKNNGCLVSEYDPDTKVFRGNYVERDAIVAAFCDVTFVVECGIKSGTMHTVNSAIDYDRQIYCYSPDDVSFDGNEYILENNENAVRVNDIEEFCNDLKNLTVNKNDKPIQQTLI